MVRCHCFRKWALITIFLFSYVSAKSLPVGYNLKYILQNDRTFVDKTRYALKLINDSEASDARSVFIARPPSFGKTIFLNMLQLIFQGKENRELFKDTEIYRSDYDWPKHPVLYFDFGSLNPQRGEVEAGLLRDIIEMEKQNNILPRLSLMEEELNNLVRQINMEKHHEAVLLVDNYDAPITRCLPEDPDIALENYKVIREFLASLEFLDVFLRLIVVTGVSRFPMNEKGLALEQFKDLTMQHEYANVMGFTEEELEMYFKNYLDKKGTRDVLQEKFFGYQFSNKTQSLYRPLPVVQHFVLDGAKSDANSPDIPEEHLVETFKKRPSVLFELRSMEEANLLLSDVKNFKKVELVPSLFQNGYLTIRNCQAKKRCQWYDLGFSTPYIEDYFLNVLLEEVLSRENITTNDQFSKIRRYLIERELTSFVGAMNIYLARVHYVRNDVNRYRNVVEFLLRISGVKAIERRRVDFNNSNGVQAECVFELVTDRNASVALHTMVSKDYQKFLFPVGNVNEMFVVGFSINSTSHVIQDLEVAVFDKNTGKISRVKRN